MNRLYMEKYLLQAIPKIIENRCYSGFSKEVLMKIHLHVDSTYEEVEIHIYTADYTEEIEKLMQL